MWNVQRGLSQHSSGHREHGRPGVHTAHSQDGEANVQQGVNHHTAGREWWVNRLFPLDRSRREANGEGFF